MTSFCLSSHCMCISGHSMKISLRSWTKLEWNYLVNCRIYWQRDNKRSQEIRIINSTLKTIEYKNSNINIKPPTTVTKTTITKTAFTCSWTYVVRFDSSNWMIIHFTEAQYRKTRRDDHPVWATNVVYASIEVRVPLPLDLRILFLVGFFLVSGDLHVLVDSSTTFVYSTFRTRQIVCTIRHLRSVVYSPY